MEHIWKIVAIVIVFLIVPRWLWSQKTKTKLAQLKRNGGNSGSQAYSLAELIQHCNRHFSTSLAKEPVMVEADSPALYDYPYLYLPASEAVDFTAEEVDCLREYLSAGGFLHINGSRTAATDKEMRRIFPDEDWVEIPRDHPVFQAQGTALQSLSACLELHASGIIREDRLMVLATSCTDRQRALQLGANVVAFALG